MAKSMCKGIKLSLLFLIALHALQANAAAPGDTARCAEGSNCVIHIWGWIAGRSSPMGKLLPQWEAEFRKLHPEVSFLHSMTGNKAAIGGLYTGAADLAFMDREISDMELDAFHQGTGRGPVSVAVAAGTPDESGKASSLVIVVNRNNPVSDVTFQQLKDIFGSSPAGTNQEHRWADVGVTGSWANYPIHPYGFSVHTDEAELFDRVVLKGTGRWSCSYREIPGGEAAIQALLARDRDGIAIMTVSQLPASLKVLPIRTENTATSTSAKKASVEMSSYPLTRTLYAYVNVDPAMPMDPNVRAFVAYILGRGQDSLRGKGGYRPLPVSIAQQELENLH
jgi:phosphate transport system substrate-binding protein